MGLKDKLINFISPVEELEDEESYVEFDKDEYRQHLSEYERGQDQSMTQLKTDAKMVLFEPRTYEESEEVARHLKDRRAAVVNLHRLPPNFAQRTIDFLTGVVFALDGSIQKIGHNVILCTPKTIGITGEINFDIEDDK